MNLSAVLDKTKAMWAKLWPKLRRLFPMKGDGTFEIVRKSLFWVAAVVLVVSLSVLIHESVVVPGAYEAEMESVRDIYRPDGDTPGNTDGDKAQNPMRLKDLRKINKDTVGWLTFQSTNERVGLDIDYPVLQGKDNDYYLNRTFYKKDNRTGSLFLDYRNRLVPRDQSLIIYGHNLSTGLMFSGLNKLVNNLYNARTATTFTLTTDEGTDTYLVFGIMLSNADPEQGPVFNYMRRNFDSAEDFNLYVAELRRRSMYDYPVEVDENDQLLLLSTCVPRRKTQYKGSRTVVMARKLREGESPAIHGSITTNKDCLYPLVYYVSKDLPIPKDYTSSTTTKPSLTTTTKATTTTTGVFETGTTLPTGSLITSNTVVGTIPSIPTGNTTVQTGTTTAVTGGNTTTTTAKVTGTTVDGTTTTAADKTTKPTKTDKTDKTNKTTTASSADSTTAETTTTAAETTTTTAEETTTTTTTTEETGSTTAAEGE